MFDTSTQHTILNNAALHLMCGHTDDIVQPRLEHLKLSHQSLKAKATQVYESDVPT